MGLWTKMKRTFSERFRGHDVLVPTPEYPPSFLEAVKAMGKALRAGGITLEHRKSRTFTGHWEKTDPDSAMDVIAEPGMWCNHGKPGELLWIRDGIARVRFRDGQYNVWMPN